MSADRSPWIAARLAEGKSSAPGRIQVSRQDDGSYVVELELDEPSDGWVRMMIARLRPVADDRWRLDWSSGDGRWKPLDPVDRTLEESLSTILRDDYGAFFG